VNRSTVQKRHASYEKAQENAQERRSALRSAVLEWKARGATIVEIADALRWSRQSVYDLIGKP
jgi:DNA-binding CsgD family transcriptional regulator